MGFISKFLLFFADNKLFTPLFSPLSIKLSHKKLLMWEISYAVTANDMTLLWRHVPCRHRSLLHSVCVARILGTLLLLCVSVCIVCVPLYDGSILDTFAALIHSYWLPNINVFTRTLFEVLKNTDSIIKFESEWQWRSSGQEEIKYSVTAL